MAANTITILKKALKAYIATNNIKLTGRLANIPAGVKIEILELYYWEFVEKQYSETNETYYNFVDDKDVKTKATHFSLDAKILEAKDKNLIGKEFYVDYLPKKDLSKYI